MEWKDRPRWMMYPWGWIANQEEARAVNFTWHSCGRLGGYIRSVQSSVSLFQSARKETIEIESRPADLLPSGTFERLSELHDWQAAAGQSAVLNIYHFIKTLETCIAQFKTFKTIWKFVDQHLIDNALLLRNQYFPNAIELRNGIAHKAERYTTLKSILEHAEMVDGVLGRAWFGAAEGDHFLVFYKRQKLFVEMTEETVIKLNRIDEVFFDAFRHLEMEVFRSTGNPPPFKPPPF